VTALAEFEPAQSGSRNALRIFRYQLSGALKRLRGRTLTDKDIHAARRNIKAARTALRLMRDALPSDVYRLYSHRVRDTAHPLSKVRDSRALIDALHGLLRHDFAVKYRRAFAAFDRSLNREWLRVKREALDTPRALWPVQEALVALIKEVGAWRPGRQNWSVVGRSLQRVYTHGYRRLAKSRAHPTASSLHAWRKQAKYLHYQLKFLEPLWRKPIKELARQLQALTEYLGEHHDLAVLAQKAAANPAWFSAAATSSVLLRLIERRQSELHREALSLGTLIYCEKPARFTERIGVYWSEWKRRGVGSKGGSG
jgi:CHAD domain-containing protein